MKENIAHIKDSDMSSEVKNVMKYLAYLHESGVSDFDILVYDKIEKVHKKLNIKLDEVKE